MTELRRATKSLDTTRRAKELLRGFYNRAEGRRPGEALAWCMAGVSSELLHAFDLPWEWPENFGTLCASRGVATGFCEQAEGDGFSQDLCSYVRNNLGYVSRMAELGRVPPETPRGGMGTATMLLGSGALCDPRTKWFQSLASRYLPLPVFHIDPLSPPHDVNVDDPRIEAHYKELLRETLHEQVAFLERQTERPLDQERLRAALGHAQEMIALLWEIHDLRRAVPSPMGSEDFFTGCVVPLLFMLGQREAAEYFRALRDEVRDRVSRGIGVIAEERFRLLWMGIPPWYNLGFFNAVGALGAVFPIETVYFVGAPVEIDLGGDPVEALVDRTWKRAVWIHRWGAEIIPENLSPSGFSQPGTRLVRQWVRDYRLDGAVMHRTRSCRAVSWGQVHIKNQVAEEGIPSLIIESDMADPRSWADSIIMGQVRGFLDAIAASRRSGARA
ncbi:MAG: 2-hydroxyacyl-CoA dehydratase [Candidatus Rokubacteria bacterium]|nr:2-hydroxyacyl-CoA dehydratase [Candidatus Rokubacteria bacterium]